MKRKECKSLLCTMVFAVVSLHALMLHGHHHACGAEAHLHGLSHCEQLDIFVPADAAPDLLPLSAVIPESVPCIEPRDRRDLSGCMPDETDAFVASEAPDIGGRGLRAPPVL